MKDRTLLGPWVRRFLAEHLIGERNLARNTQKSYRDTLILLLPFSGTLLGKPLERLTVEDLDAATVQRFLQYLEVERNCSVATRNQRLAAIHALSRFISQHSPEHIAWSSAVRGIPFKKAPKPVMAYLDKMEMEAILATPNRNSPQGPRDHALLLFLYNTGARVDEAARLAIADLVRGSSSSVRLTGKGGKIRHCPLWPKTAAALDRIVVGRAPHDAVFLNRRGEPLTRFGIHALIKRCTRQAAGRVESLKTKHVSAHTFRHTTAVHLLRSGVDINTIRAWLGHVSLDTTNVYAEVDLEMKAEALAHCEVPDGATSKRWSKEPALMAFLKELGRAEGAKVMLPGT
jgi:integrase/recombinase XerD